MSNGIKAFLGVCGAILLIAFFWVLAVGVFGSASNETADFRGGVEQRNNTNGNGIYRQSQYEAFYNDCHSLVEAQTQIDADNEPGADAGLPPSVFAANKNSDLRTYKDLAAQYNAKAGAVNTSGQFRSAGLPESVPPSYAANQEKITCAY